MKKLNKEVWSDHTGRKVYAYTDEVLPFTVPLHHKIGNLVFDQTVQYMSETDTHISLYMNSPAPPIITSLAPFNIRYGLNYFFRTYRLDYDKKTAALTYKAYAKVSVNPIAIHEHHTFKYLAANYNSAGEPLGDLEIYMSCNFETLQVVCAKSNVKLPKSNIILDKNDVVSLTCNYADVREVRSIQYHDIRSFSIS